VLDGSGSLVLDGAVLVLHGAARVLLEATGTGLWNGTGLVWRNISGLMDHGTG